MALYQCHDEEEQEHHPGIGWRAWEKQARNQSGVTLPAPSFMLGEKATRPAPQRPLAQHPPEDHEIPIEEGEIHDWERF